MNSSAITPKTPDRFSQCGGKNSSLGAKILSKSELKSSIPKPTPLVRREHIERPSTSSSQSTPVRFSRIPKPTFHSTDRGNTSMSLNCRGLSPSTDFDLKESKRKNFQQKISRSRSSSPKSKKKERPKTASVIISNSNTYPTIKGKVSRSPPVTPLKKSAMRERSFELCGSTNKGTPAEGKQSKNNILETQKQLLHIFQELKRFQPSMDLQPLEKEICSLLQKKALGHLEQFSFENSSILNEATPEFLTTFEKQMQEVGESWVQLICDVISTRMISCGSSLSRVSLPDPTLNVRDEVFRLLTSLSTEGESLTEKLQKIEDENLKMMTLVIHNVLALSREYEGLKDKHFRLEKTQDQIHYELKEELAILSEENKELDRKYTLAVEKYNLEKSKTDQLEKHKLTINREVTEVRKMLKCMGSKCAEMETKVKKFDGSCKALETAIRNVEISRDKEVKQFRELINKHEDAKKIISKLESDLNTSNEERIAIEASNNMLKEQLENMKSSIADDLEKRNTLQEEVETKNKKLNEIQAELEMVKGQGLIGGSLSVQSGNSSVLVEDLTNAVRQRNHQIEELMKKMNNMEKMLKDKTNKEEMLMKQLSDLQKEPNENEIPLRSQLKDLHYTVKDLLSEKAELERIIAQKTLELDQRDLLMKQHARIVQARDELIPMIQDRQCNEKERIKRLGAVVYQLQKLDYGQGQIGQDQNEDTRSLVESVKSLANHFDVDPELVDKELSFRQEKMAELFSLLENKQMEVMRLERRLREVQGVKEERSKMEKERESWMSPNQKEMNERKPNKNRGIFSLFSGQADGSSY